MALLGALAADQEPDRRSAPPVELEQFGTAQREAIAERLKEILSEMQGLDAKAARTATADLEGRLGAVVVDREESNGDDGYFRRLRRRMRS